MIEVIRREWVYLWYYFTLQLKQIAPYYTLKIVLGAKRFLLYLAFVMAFSLVTGLIVKFDSMRD